MRRVSLCIVAQDAAAHLRSCIASAEKVASQIVVVDTGSRDDTVNIAQECGAQVIHLLQPDDKCAALQAALHASSCEWILILQPDETLAPGADDTLCEAIDAEPFVYALLPVIESDCLESSLEDVLQGKTQMGIPRYLPRLLKKTDDLSQDTGAILDLKAWFSSHREDAVRIPAPIVSHGPARREITDTSSPDTITRLQKQVTQDPRSWMARSHLAEALLDSNRSDEANEECEIAWTLVQANWRLHHQMASTPRGTTKVAHLRAVVQVQRGDFNAALETLRTARKMGAIHPNLDYVYAAAHEQMALWAVTPEAREGHLATAREQFSAAISQHGRSYAEPLQHGVTSWSAGVRLGIVLLQEDQPDRAMRCFQAALERSPDPIDAVLGIAETLLDIGQPAETLHVLEPYLNRETADGWLLAADAAQRLGDVGLFNEYIQHACELASTRLRSLHRLPRLDGLLVKPKAS